MQSKLTFWLFTLLWFFAGTWWYGSCSKCANCVLPVAPPITSTSTASGFSVRDSSWHVFSADNLRFGKSDDEPVIAANITQSLDSVVNYAKNHTDKKVTITGYYSADEKNNTSFADLGLARADKLKNWLAAKGLAESNIDIKSEVSGKMIFSPTDTLIGGISMVFSTLSTPATIIADSIKKDLFKPRTVYFVTGQNTLLITPALKYYLQQASEYLKNNRDKELLVTGYTDNVGDVEKNITLSAARAAFVKEKLAGEEIAENRIEAIGKGMADPIADNTTAKGRAENRRVTIQLQ